MFCRHSREELEQIDSEGRCVVTDHGEFVLFNVYGAAISNEENAAERYAYKLDFYKASPSAWSLAPCLLHHCSEMTLVPRFISALR